MKIKILFATLIALATTNLFGQAISIDSARSLPVGTVVTVKGVVTNGSELGVIRYLEDGTAGIAAYSSTLTANVHRGDSITVTGTLKNYNQLLELDPVASLTVTSTGNTLPTPQVITPSQMDESYEGELVRINSLTFTTNPGGTFASNTSYNFTSGGQTGVIYVRSGHPLIGQVVPSGAVDVVGITSQFHYSSPTSGYQLLPRDTNDIIFTSGIMVTSKVGVTGISQTGFTIDWTTSANGTTELFYGSTPALGNHASSAGTTASHTYSFSSLTPAQLVYVRAFSVAGTDTAFAPITPFITQSSSTGNMKVYFNTPVDNSVSSGTNAIFLNQLIDDTLIAYINRAQSSIDFTMYNFNNTGLSNISAALNDAYSRGVTVRVIFDGTANNDGVQSLVSGIKKIGSPTSASYGIMHNKFIIFDAYATNQNVPIVWTGATNMTDGQVNLDANNVIIVQDKSLAIAYTLEFNEMFGSETAIPSLTESKFGPFKSDNTPHDFIIDGKTVKCYFSPTDGTNAKLIETIQSANTNISIATMLITRSDLDYALQAAINSGVDTRIVVNAEGDCTPAVWANLKALLGNKLVDDATVPGIMHNKYMIVDEGTTSDPVLWTGSHNWSNAANNTNDENTLVIHDATIANIYYQNFKYKYSQLTQAINETNQNISSMKLYPNPASNVVNMEFESKANSNAEVIIYDVNGKIINTSNSTISVGNNKIQVNVASQPSGFYFVQIKTEEGSVFHKFTIE